MGRRKQVEDEAELPVGLWEYLQPYVAEEPAPSLEWAVRRTEPMLADEGARQTRVVPSTALA